MPVDGAGSGAVDCPERVIFFTGCVLAHGLFPLGIIRTLMRIWGWAALPCGAILKGARNFSAPV